MEKPTLHIYSKKSSKRLKKSKDTPHKYNRFDDILENNFETGDVLLFHNSRNCFFKFVECCTHSKYSHVAMILKDPEFTDPPLKGLYIIESGTEPFKDSENHRSKFGVQIVPLQLVLSTYKGAIYWRKLRLNIERDDKFERTLAVAHNYVHNLPYDIDPLDWLNAAFGAYKPNSKSAHKLNTFWCSALIAFMYAMIGLLPKSVPWSYIRPVDWGTEHPSQLDFVHCTLECERRLK